MELIGAMSKGMTEIYMISRCPKRWDGKDIRDKCEVKTGKIKDYRDQIPVLSKNTNVTYKNMHCAICNEDTNLAKWNVTISCDDGSVTKDMFSSDKYINSKNYLPKRHQWWFEHGHIMIKCSLRIDQFKLGGKYAEKYNARVCKPVIKTCLKEWTGSEEETKCKEFASYRYFSQRVYKNEHCAACNNISAEFLSCIFRPPNRQRTYASVPYWHRTHSTFNILFDFNILSGDHVAVPESKCPIGEIFDPLKKKCISVHCGRLYKSVDGKCTRDFKTKYLNNSLASDCHTTSLLPEEYTILQNESVWVNNTNMLYAIGEYELGAPRNDSSMELLICVEEEYDEFLKFSWLQGLVSTICHYVSIICLLLHISVYALLPKMRNLPGKNLLSLSVSLLFAQLLFLYGIDSQATLIFCSMLSVAMHFFFLAYFFWMNVMALDICFTFKSNSHRSSSGNSTFRRCSLYAWLTPALIVAFSVLVDNTSFIPRTYR